MPVFRHRLTSRVLAGNPLGDPIERDLHVYVPPGYDPAASRRWPALLALVGFTGTGGNLFNVDPLTEALHDKLDRMIASGACPPMIVAAPDCFTRVGGNQHINSAGTGRYEDYLIDEIIAFVDANYRTMPRGHWGVFGKSSGGYGAIVLGMRRPELAGLEVERPVDPRVRRGCLGVGRVVRRHADRVERLEVLLAAPVGIGPVALEPRRRTAGVAERVERRREVLHVA